MLLWLLMWWKPIQVIIILSKIFFAGLYFILLVLVKVNSLFMQNHTFFIFIMSQGMSYQVPHCLLRLVSFFMVEGEMKFLLICILHNVDLRVCSCRVSVSISAMDSSCLNSTLPIILNIVRLQVHQLIFQFNTQWFLGLHAYVPFQSKTFHLSQYLCT